jgi:catechol 2,3-dioxygenase
MNLKNKNLLFLVFLNLLAFGVAGFIVFKPSLSANAAANSETPVSVLTSRLEMGTLELNVNNMEQMKDFYHTIAGLEILKEDKNTVLLGYRDRGVIKLNNTPGLPPPSASSTGLDQIAIVYNSQTGLAKALQNVLKLNPSLFQGATDRGISQAFYVVDPQGNSLEMYYDSDPSTWPRRYGKVQMDQKDLDINQYVQTYANGNGELGAKIGHIQTRVGDAAKAKTFYVDTLGFFVASQFGSNGYFLSDGFYHHNLGIEQWQGSDTGKQPEHIGLKSYELILAKNSDIDKLKDRLKKAHVDYTQQNDMLTIVDQWGTIIHVKKYSKGFWDIL